MAVTPLCPNQSTPTVDSLRRWLSHGEILSPAGAYYAWYDADNERPAFEYPEITGYALTHLASQRDLTAIERTSATAAALWLVNRWRSGDRSAHSGWDADRTYYFDLAMQANGLLLAGSRLGIDPALHVGAAIVDALVAEIREFGYLPAVPDRGRISRPGWSTQGVPHMGKGMQCLLHARLLFPERASDLDMAVDSVVRQTLSSQRPDGRFVTDPADEVTMLHPHLYSVEGLWCHAQATGDVVSAQAAKAGAAWVWNRQLGSGGLPRYVRVDGRDCDAPEQVDLTSQALRAAHLTGTNLEAASRAAERLVSLAIVRGEGTAALPYQPTSGQSHLNSWVTMFAAQALRVAAGAETLSWQELV